LLQSEMSENNFDENNSEEENSIDNEIKNVFNSNGEIINEDKDVNIDKDDVISL